MWYQSSQSTVSTKSFLPDTLYLFGQTQHDTGAPVNIKGFVAVQTDVCDVLVPVWKAIDPAVGQILASQQVFA